MTTQRVTLKTEVQAAWEAEGYTKNGKQVVETYHLADTYCEVREARQAATPSMETLDEWYERGFAAADEWTVGEPETAVEPEAPSGDATGAAGMLVELSKGTVTVTHSQTGEVLLVQAANVGDWDRVWATLRSLGEVAAGPRFAASGR